MGCLLFWLVVSTRLKNMSSSVVMILPNIWKVVKFTFQTTNQIIVLVGALLSSCFLFDDYTSFIGHGLGLEITP
jgi:hypothetical protein